MNERNDGDEISADAVYQTMIAYYQFTHIRIFVLRHASATVWKLAQ